jgi:hypothetical protein
MSGARAVRETTSIFQACPRNYLKLRHFLWQDQASSRVESDRAAISPGFAPLRTDRQHVALPNS